MTVETMTDTLADEMARAYIECALWVGVFDVEGEDPRTDLTADDVSPQLAESVRASVSDFLALVSMTDLGRWPADLAGHDLFLTRNGHGAGFWDRGHGAAGERLTDWAHSLGSDDWYIGDDGLIYN